MCACVFSACMYKCYMQGVMLQQLRVEVSDFVVLKLKVWMKNVSDQQQKSVGHISPTDRCAGTFGSRYISGYQDPTSAYVSPARVKVHPEDESLPEKPGVVFLGWSLMYCKILIRKAFIAYGVALNPAICGNSRSGAVCTCLKPLLKIE